MPNALQPIVFNLLSVMGRIRVAGAAIQIFLAHNVVNKQDEMRDFISAIRDNPVLFTAIVSPSGEGMSVTYKVKREK